MKHTSSLDIIEELAGGKHKIKFPYGELYSTRGAMRELCPDDAVHALLRHVCGDWGDVDEHDRRENELALKAGHRLLSVYHTSKGRRFWIITEADRSCTTILLPEEN